MTFSVPDQGIAPDDFQRTWSRDRSWWLSAYLIKGSLPMTFSVPDQGIVRTKLDIYVFYLW